MADAVAQVAEAVGIEREQRVDVARGDDAGRRQPDELARVTTQLVGVVHIKADQIQLWVLNDAPQGQPPGVAGAPVDDSSRHAHALPVPTGSWPRS